MSTILEQYKQAARAALAEEEQERQACQEAFRAQAVEKAKGFIHEQGLADMLSELHMGGEARFDLPGIDSGYDVHYVQGPIKEDGLICFYDDYGRYKAKIDFPSMRCLYLPASQEAIGEWLIDLEKNARENRQRAFNLATNRLVWTTSIETMEAALKDALVEFSDQAETLAQIVDSKRTGLEQARREAEQLAREEAAQLAQEEADRAKALAEAEKLQSEIWFPFSVYRVYYGIVAGDGEDEGTYADTASIYSLRSEPGDGGWWARIDKWIGRPQTPVRLMHPVMIEKLEVREPEIHEFCQFRAGVFYPPEGAERL